MSLSDRIKQIREEQDRQAKQSQGQKESAQAQGETWLKYVAEPVLRAIYKDMSSDVAINCMMEHSRHLQAKLAGKYGRALDIRLKTGIREDGSASVEVETVPGGEIIFNARPKAPVDTVDAEMLKQAIEERILDFYSLRLQ